MSAIPDFKLWGVRTFRLKPDKLVKRAQEVHSLSGHWQVPSSGYFKPGDNAPGYDRMRIVSVDEDPEIIDETQGAYEQRLDCEGIAGDESHLVLGHAERRPEEGWDECAIRIFTDDPDHARWAKGARLVDDAGALVPGFEYMFIADRAVRKHRAAGFWEMDLTLKGLRTSKPYKRRINGAETVTTSKFDGSGSLSANIYQNYPPVDSGSDGTLSGSNLLVEYSQPGISLSDTLISTTAPPTDKIGQFWTPPDAPDISILTLIGEADKYFFPFGWKCVSIVSEKLADASVWLVTYNFVYQVSHMPTQSTP